MTFKIKPLYLRTHFHATLFTYIPTEKRNVQHLCPIEVLLYFLTAPFWRQIIFIYFIFHSHTHENKIVKNCKNKCTQTTENITRTYLRKNWKNIIFKCICVHILPHMGSWFWFSFYFYFNILLLLFPSSWTVKTHCIASK